jgi:nucleotide-binding universal stress UspA family protein
MSTMTGQTVVVGVDGSDRGRQAVRWAAAAAGLRDAPLRLVHAVPMPAGYPPGIVDWHNLRDALETQGRAWLEEARVAAGQAVPGLRVEVALEVAPAVVTLLGESRRAGLLVLGSRGLGGFTGLLVGSTSVELAAHAHCPVVVVPDQQAEDALPAGGPVIVGVDGTPAGEAAIEFAFAEAARRRSDLVAVHAWSDLLLEVAFAGAADALEISRVAEQARELLAERLAGRPADYPDVRVTREVVHSHPTRALLRHAAGAQLVVVGSRGRGGFTGLLLGSTSQHLLHHAQCPVAVVRTQPSG